MPPVAPAVAPPVAPAAAQAAAPRDATEAGFAFAEVRLGRAACFAGEPIHVTFRFGFQREFLRQNLVPLFRQPLDLPVQWRIPWIDGLAGLVPRQAALPLGPPSPGEEGLSFVLNDAAALAREVEEPTLGGPAMRVFEFQRTFLALEPGEVTLPASRLGFAWATSFQEHAFSDLSAQDRLEGFVTAPPRRVRIEPLPEWAPPGFGGAVGRLSLTASLSADQVAVGSSVRLSVRIAGDGNLESFAAPELPSDDAWHVRGRIDHWRFEGAKPGGTPSPAGPGAGERTIEYDLSPRHASVTRVPQVRFVYFDPAPPAGYRTLESESLGIRVLPGPAAQGAPAPPAGTADGVQEEPVSTRPWIWFTGGVAALLIALGIRRLARGRRGKLAD